MDFHRKLTKKSLFKVKKTQDEIRAGGGAIGELQINWIRKLGEGFKKKKI